jgi:hypothetical protein
MRYAGPVAFSVLSCQLHQSAICNRERCEVLLWLTYIKGRRLMQGMRGECCVDRTGNGHGAQRTGHGAGRGRQRGRYRSSPRVLLARKGPRRPSCCRRSSKPIPVHRINFSPKAFHLAATCCSISRLLKNSFSSRLLKKVQMQGGVTHPSDGYPGPSEAYPARGERVEPRSERRARGYPP